MKSRDGLRRCTGAPLLDSHVKERLTNVGDQKLQYRLPLSAVRVSGTLKHTHDTILEKDSSEPSVGVELITIGDPTYEFTLTYRHGVLNDTTLGLERSEDGRLTSGSGESTGQATKVVTAATGLIATGIGFAIAGVPGAALAAAAIAARPRAVAPTEAEPRAVSDDDNKIAKKYRENHVALANARVELADRLNALRSTVANLAAEVASIRDSDARREKTRELKAAAAALGFVRTELDAVDRHFATWRASTLTTRVEEVDRLITLDEFAVAGKGSINDEGKLVFDDPQADAPRQAARAKLEELWNTLNLFLEFADDPEVTNAKPQDQPTNNTVLYREPRWAVLTVCTRDGKKPVRKSTKRYAILDRRCTHQTFELRHSLFARKSSKLTFSTAGVATGFASGSSSSVAGFAETVSGVPGAISTGLTSAGGITDSVYALRNKALDNELARVKKEVELRQQRIADAGLDVTEDQAAELLGLKQRQEMLEANKAILEASNAIEDLEAPDAGPTELARLQAEVALLRVQLEKAVLQGALAQGRQDEPDVGDVLRYLRPV